MTGEYMTRDVACVASADGRRDQAGPMPSARLLYDVSHPFEVGLELGNAANQLVLWRLSRDLLHRGLLIRSATPVGAGDVRVSVHEDEVRLALSSDTGHVVLWLPETEMREFLADTIDEVPLGTEAGHVDWDAVIEWMLEGPVMTAVVATVAVLVAAVLVWLSSLVMPVPVAVALVAVLAAGLLVLAGVRLARADAETRRRGHQVVAVADGSRVFCNARRSEFRRAVEVACTEDSAHSPEDANLIVARRNGRIEREVSR